MGIFESIFDVSYLISVVVISVLILKKGSRRDIVLFGLMGLLLGFGDAFHLIPRIIAHLTTGMDDYQTALGIGKLITSITMTIFYVLLYLSYEATHGENKKFRNLLYSLVLIRFVLLALPGNSWLANDGTLFYGILRNIPFALIGGILVYEFYKSKDRMYTKIAFWVIVSFICYAIVVVGAGFVPALGAFMMPKTIAYLIIVILGYKYIKED